MTGPQMRGRKMRLREGGSGMLVKSFAGVVRRKADSDTAIEVVLSSSRRDRMGERIMPSAFRRWWEDHPEDRENMPMLREHATLAVVGTWNDFELREMEDGKNVELYAEGELIAGLSGSKDAEILIDRGLYKATSIGFYAGGFMWDRESDTLEIGFVRIKEGSLVLFPANDDAIIRASVYSGGRVDRKALDRILSTQTDLTAGDRKAIADFATRQEPARPDYVSQLLEAMSQ